MEFEATAPKGKDIRAEVTKLVLEATDKREYKALAKARQAILRGEFFALHVVNDATAES